MIWLGLFCSCTMYTCVYVFGKEGKDWDYGLIGTSIYPVYKSWAHNHRWKHKLHRVQWKMCPGFLSHCPLTKQWLQSALLYTDLSYQSQHCHLAPGSKEGPKETSIHFTAFFLKKNHSKVATELNFWSAKDGMLAETQQYVAAHHGLVLPSAQQSRHQMSPTPPHL